MLNISSRSLQAFLLLADCRQFRLAAERFHVTQSAFSQIIGRLEQQLGITLFTRNSRNVELTPEGYHLLPQARRLLKDLDTSIASLHSFAKTRAQRVSLAAMAALSSHWLPWCISQFRDVRPEVQVQLHDTRYDDGIQLLREGLIDFALEPYLDTLSEFHTELLFEEGFYVICAKEGELKGQHKIRLTDLAGIRLISPSKSGGVWRQIGPALSGIAYIDTGFEAGHYTTIAGLAGQNLGAGIVPGSALPLFRDNRLRAIPITDPGLSRRVSIVMRKGYPASSSTRAFIEHLYVMLKERPPL